MNQQKRQRLLLGALLVLLAFVGLRAIFRFVSSDQPGGRGRRSASAQRGSARSSADLEVVDLRLDELRHLPATYTPGRDPFNFGASRPERRPEPPPVRTRAEPERAQPQAASAPDVELVYLGNFGPAGGRIAVFSDGEEIINARVGDILKKEFVVVSIGYESADLEFVNFPEVPAARLPVGG